MFPSNRTIPWPEQITECLIWFSPTKSRTKKHQKTWKQLQVQSKHRGTFSPRCFTEILTYKSPTSHGPQVSVDLPKFNSKRPWKNYRNPFWKPDHLPSNQPFSGAFAAKLRGCTGFFWVSILKYSFPVSFPHCIFSTQLDVFMSKWLHIYSSSPSRSEKKCTWNHHHLYTFSLGPAQTLFSG